MVDWSLARQVARLAAGSGDEGPPQADVAALCLEMEALVAAYTGLSPATPVPAAEVVGRGEWAALNLDSLAQLLDPVAARLDRRLEFAGPLAGALKAGAAATVAAEAGLVIGYIAQRVLGSTRCRCSEATRRRACCSWGPTCARLCASWRWSPTPSTAGSARTSSRTCSSSRASTGCANTSAA
jgi:hypothetical protein